MGLLRRQSPRLRPSRANIEAGAVLEPHVFYSAACAILLLRRQAGWQPAPAEHKAAATRGFAAAAEPAPAVEESEDRGPEPMLEPHPEPRRRQPRQLPLDFGDPAAAFGAKSTRELLLTWAVFTACQARSAGERLLRIGV